MHGLGGHGPVAPPLDPPLQLGDIKISTTENRATKCWCSLATAATQSTQLCISRFRLRQDIRIAPFRAYTHLSLKALRYATCWRGITVLPATRTRIHEWNELSCLYSPATAHHALWPVRYSFPDPQRVGGWVGLGGWLHTELVCLTEDDYPPQWAQYQPTDIVPRRPGANSNHDHSIARK